jgi:hypothetical protein
MKSASIRLLACVLAAFTVPVSFGAAADRQQSQAQLLDQNQYLCDNCFFGPSNYYFCFAVGSKVLIGRERIPTLDWRNTSKNYLTKAHKNWIPWAAPGQSVDLSYDDKHIWVKRADGKEVKMTQDYTQDLFDNAQCRSAVRKTAK